MKKILVIAVVCLFLGSITLGFAETKPSYLNPQSKEYYKPEIGGICEKCGKVFTFSGYQLDNDKTAKCPYCKHEQSLKEACNRYGEAILPKKKK